jgi:hypothetical protein
MSLVARDSKLMQRLGKYGVLSTAQIHEGLFPGIRKTTMLRRLRKLEARDQIRRVAGLPDGSYGWTLTSRQSTALGFSGISRHTSRISVDHDVLLSAVRLALERAGIETRWTPEHVLRHRAWEARKPNGMIPENIPDGVFTTMIGDQIRAVSVELELSAKNSERYRKILTSYREKRQLWGFWYIVSHESIAVKIGKIWRKVARDSKAPRFVWSLFDEVCKNPADAKLHYGGSAFPLGTIFTKRAVAHSPAHPVSRAY